MSNPDRLSDNILMNQCIHDYLTKVISGLPGTTSKETEGQVITEPSESFNAGKHRASFYTNEFIFQNGVVAYSWAAMVIDYLDPNFEYYGYYNSDGEIFKILRMTRLKSSFSFNSSGQMSVGILTDDDILEGDPVADLLEQYQFIPDARDVHHSNSDKPERWYESIFGIFNNLNSNYPDLFPNFQLFLNQREAERLLRLS